MWRPSISRLHRKVLAPQQYEADSLLRTYRGVRMREIGEDAPDSTVGRAARSRPCWR